MRLPALGLPSLALPALDARARRVVLLVLIASVLALGVWWAYHSPLLSIRHVEVRGTATLAPEDVAAIAGLEGDSVIQPDFESARQRLLALPAAKQVSIERDLPNGAVITIVERTPWGFWQAGQQRFVIDEEGVVLDMPVPDGAPVIVQTDVLASPLVPGARVDDGAIGVAKMLVATAQQTLGREVAALEFSQASGLSAVFTDGLRATFGDAQGYDFKVASLYAVLKRAEEQGRTLQRVDLRFGDRVAVQ
jgi:cell division protein FtsQ